MSENFGNAKNLELPLQDKSANTDAKKADVVTSIRSFNKPSLQLTTSEANSSLREMNETKKGPMQKSDSKELSVIESPSQIIEPVQDADVVHAQSSQMSMNMKEDLKIIESGALPDMDLILNIDDKELFKQQERKVLKQKQFQMASSLMQESRGDSSVPVQSNQNYQMQKRLSQEQFKLQSQGSVHTRKSEVRNGRNQSNLSANYGNSYNQIGQKAPQNVLLPNINVRIGGHPVPPLKFPPNISPGNQFRNSKGLNKQRFRSPQAPKAGNNIFSPYSSQKGESLRPTVFENTKLRASSNIRASQPQNPFNTQSKIAIQGRQSQIINKKTAAMNNLKTSIQIPHLSDLNLNTNRSMSLDNFYNLMKSSQLENEAKQAVLISQALDLNEQTNVNMSIEEIITIMRSQGFQGPNSPSVPGSMPSSTIYQDSNGRTVPVFDDFVQRSLYEKFNNHNLLVSDLQKIESQNLSNQQRLQAIQNYQMSSRTHQNKNLAQSMNSNHNDQTVGSSLDEQLSTDRQRQEEILKQRAKYIKNQKLISQQQENGAILSSKIIKNQQLQSLIDDQIKHQALFGSKQQMSVQQLRIEEQSSQLQRNESEIQTQQSREQKMESKPFQLSDKDLRNIQTSQDKDKGIHQQKHDTEEGQKIVLNKDMITVGTNHQLSEMDQLQGVNDYQESTHSPRQEKMGLYSSNEPERTDNLLPWNVKISSKNQFDVQKSFGTSESPFEAAKMSFQNPYIQQKVLNGPSVLGKHHNFLRDAQKTDDSQQKQFFSRGYDNQSPTINFRKHYENGAHLGFAKDTKSSQLFDKETSNMKSTQRNPHGYEAATSTSFKSLKEMEKVIMTKNRKTPVLNRHKKRAPTLNEPLYGVSEAFNKTYLDLTRTAEKITTTQIDNQRQLISREMSKSVLVGPDKNHLPQNLQRTRFMNIESQKSRPWIDNSSRITTHQDGDPKQTSKYFGSSHSNFKGGANSLLATSFQESQKLNDLLNIKSGSVDLNEPKQVVIQSMDNSSQNSNDEGCSPGSSLKKKNPFRDSSKGKKGNVVSFERQVSQEIEKQFKKKNGYQALEQRKALREMKRSLNKRKQNVDKLVKGNILNTKKYQSQLKYYEGLNQRYSSVSRQQSSVILANMKSGSLSPDEQTIIQNLLPDIEARKSRLARLNELKLLKQGSSRESTIERKSPVGRLEATSNRVDKPSIMNIEVQKGTSSSRKGTTRKDAVKLLIKEAKQRARETEPAQNDQIQESDSEIDETQTGHQELDTSRGPSPDGSIGASPKGNSSILQQPDENLKHLKTSGSQEFIPKNKRVQKPTLAQALRNGLNQERLNTDQIRKVQKRNTALEVIMAETIDDEGNTQLASQQQTLSPAKNYQIKIFPQNAFQQAISQKNLNSASTNQQKTFNQDQLPNLSAFSQIKNNFGPAVIHDSPSSQKYSPTKSYNNQESPAQLIKRTMSKNKIEGVNGFMSRSLLNGRIQNLEDHGAYNELEWTFLDNNVTHYRSVFNQPKEKYKNQLKKPEFTTSIQEKKYQSVSPRKLEFDEESDETDAEVQQSLIEEEKVIKMFQRYLESIGHDELEEQLKYFIDDGRDPNELVRRDLGMHIQYGIHRQRVRESEIPLSMIFNEKVDHIKDFERKSNREIAPLQLALLDNFNIGPAEGVHLGTSKKQDLSIASIKCESYALQYNHIFQNIEKFPQNGLFLSDLERTQLLQKAEDYAKKDTLIKENLEQIQNNLNKKPDSEFSQITKHIPVAKPNNGQGDEDQEKLVILENFDGLTGKEPNNEIQYTMKERQRNLPEAYIKLIKTSKIFQNQSSNNDQKEQSSKNTFPNPTEADQSPLSSIITITEKSPVPKKPKNVHTSHSPPSSPGTRSPLLSKSKKPFDKNKNKFDQRLINLTTELIKKSALLKEDKDIPKDQQKVRIERIKALTHELYKQFQIEVLQPSTEYLINNNKSYYKLYDQIRHSQIENRPMAEKIGLNSTTQTKVIGQSINYGIYDLKGKLSADKISLQMIQPSNSPTKDKPLHKKGDPPKQPTTERTLVERYIKESFADPKYDFNNQSNRETALRTMRGSVLNEVDRFQQAIKTKVISTQAEQIQEKFNLKSLKEKQAKDTLKRRMTTEGEALKNILIENMGELVKNQGEQEKVAMEQLVGKYRADEELKHKAFHILNPQELMQKLYLK